MTVQELVIKVYEMMGDHSQLNPYTDPVNKTGFSVATAGAVRILQRLNDAMKHIYGYKTKNGRGLDIPGSTEEVYFGMTSVSGTAAGGGEKTITLPEAAGANANQYNGWIIEITDGTAEGEKMLITNYTTGRVATVHKAWTTEPDATSEFVMYHRDYRLVASDSFYADEHISLSPNTGIFAVLKVIDMTAGELERGPKDEDWYGTILEYGDPTLFVHRGNIIRFNVAPDDADKWYKLEYKRQPAVLATASQVPELPENLHAAVWLYALWDLNIWDQDSGSAWARKNDLQDFLERQVSVADSDYTRDDFRMQTE